MSASLPFDDDRVRIFNVFFKTSVSKVVAADVSICHSSVDWETRSEIQSVSDFLAGRIEQVVAARTLSKPLHGVVFTLERRRR